ncbi:MAG: hypothetical protein WA957_05220 [Alteraurantiacibacter sp.]
MSIGSLAMLFSIPANAQINPQTRLVKCGQESCLQVSGYRQHSGEQVMINGLMTDAEGRHRWRVELPIDAVRELSEPRARTLTVVLRDPETQDETFSRAILPIGLLGDSSTLGSLRVLAP